MQGIDCAPSKVWIRFFDPHFWLFIHENALCLRFSGVNSHKWGSKKRFYTYIHNKIRAGTFGPPCNYNESSISFQYSSKFE